MEEIKMYFTELQKERFKRDEAIFEEYSEIMKAHEGFVTPWRIAGMLAPKYGICQMAVRNAIKRIEGSRLNDRESFGASSLDDLPPMQDGK